MAFQFKNDEAVFKVTTIGTRDYLRHLRLLNQSESR